MAILYSTKFIIVKDKLVIFVNLILVLKKRSTQAGLNPNPGRCICFSSARSSKIKIRTSSWHKAQLALGHVEVRILIFDDPAEQERSQRP